MNEIEENKIKQAVINGLIERFDFLEDETDVNFSTTKKIILRFARKHKMFD